MADVSLTLGSNNYPLTVVNGTELQLSLSGPTGPTGPTGAAGPNTVSTSTTTSLNGYLYGNGTTVGGATSATSSATANTLALRDGSGGSNFAAVGATSVTSSGAITATKSIITTGNNSNIATSGEFSSISTGGSDAFIATSGSNAHIFTQNPTSYIQTGSTFKLYNGTYTTTLSHSPTANRAIAFPNAGGTIALTSDIPTVDATVTDGSANAVSGNAVFDALALKAPLASPNFTGEVYIQNTGRGAFITSQTATAAEIFSNSGTAADIFSTSGSGAVIESGSGTGAKIVGSTGTYHAQFGNSGINQSFVSRVKGAFGWIRGAYTGRIHPPDTITADRTYTLPDDTGTLALINPSSGTQTFSGSQIFDSTTRPTSSGTGPPQQTSLMTRDDAAAHAYFSRRLFGNCSGTTGGGGSGATSRRQGAQGFFDGDLQTTTTAGAFYKINIVSGVGISSLMGLASSGSVNLSAKWSMFFRIAMQMGTNSHFYLCIGADGVSGIPSSGTSVGMEITSATVARLFRCNAGAAVYSSNATISGITTTTPTTDLFFWVDNDGAGNLSLFFAPKLFSASMPAKPATAITTLAGVASGFTGSDVAMYLRATAASPSVFTGLNMRDVVFTEY
jgi:hypothetical protein